MDPHLYVVFSFQEVIKLISNLLACIFFYSHDHNEDAFIGNRDIVFDLYNEFP